MSGSSSSFQIRGKLEVVDNRVVIYEIDCNGKVSDHPKDLMGMIEASFKRDIDNELFPGEVLILTEQTDNNVKLMNNNSYYVHFFAILRNDKVK